MLHCSMANINDDAVLLESTSQKLCGRVYLSVCLVRQAMVS